MTLFRLALVMFCCAVPVRAAEIVVLSEFMAANSTTLADEDGAFSDWVEIYNAGPGTVDLSGWHLTDNAASLTKWTFPSTNLGPNRYLVVFCSGKNRRVPGAPLHTSFSLNAAGEFLALVRPNGSSIATQFAPVYPPQANDISHGLAATGSASNLISAGAPARMIVPAADLGTAWRTLSYNDTAWTAGPLGLGYDTGTNYDAAIGTDVQAAMFNVRASAYARVRFTVPNPGQYEGLELSLRYDDGFTAFLNGAEVLRRNAPATLLWNSAAPANHGPPPPGTLAQNFETGTTTNYALTQMASAPAPAVQPAGAGSAGQFLRLANDGVNNHNNAVTFTQTAPGLYETIRADFDFRVSSVNDPADGFAFLLIPTGVYGTNGPGYSVGIAFEEPNIAGVFAVGFDVYPRSEPRNDVSVHWDGTERVNVTLPDAQVNLTSGQFHRCRVTLTHVSGGARVTVTFTRDVNGTPGTPYTPIDNLFIAGLNPYDARIEFAARTGGLDMNVDLDNVNVLFSPSAGPVAFETFDLSALIPSLIPGTNLLALHGLNLAAGDNDFLLDPRLVARDVEYQTNQPRFFTPSTPGAANGSGALGVLSAPAFAPPGGVYASSQTVTLSSSSSSATIRYTQDGSEPTASSPAYAGPISVTSSRVLRARAFLNGYVPSGTRGEPYTILGADALNFTSNLPLLILNTYGGPIVDNVKNPGYVTVIDTFRGRSSLRGAIDFQGRVGVELRGSSSLGFPKNSMAFEVQDESTGDDRAAGMLGLPAESDWVLYAPYTDKALLRDVLAYDLWEDMGHYSVRRRFVEVFRDQDGGTLTMGAYWGVYVLLEKIKRDGDRVDIAGLDPADVAEPEVSGGYILKRDRFDPGDNAITTSTGIGLGLEYPKDSDLAPAQQSWLVNWLNQMEAALNGANFRDPVLGYARYLDVGSFIDHQWIVEMPKNIDGYRLSNYYHKDRNGRLEEGPIWDWNLSFGNADYLEGWLTNNWYYPFVGDGDYPWYRRLFADPDFNQRYLDRWGELRQSVFAPSKMLARVEAHTNLLNEAQAREFNRWPRLGTYIWPNAAEDWTNTTYAGHIGFLKRFITGRLAWIDAQFLAAPVFSQPGGPIPPGFALAMSGATEPVHYSLDGTDPRLTGGGLNPAAVLYTGPVNLPANARVVARARSAAGAWSPATAATFVINTPPLVLTEIMYHPAPLAGNTNSEDAFEFIELKNVSLAPFALGATRFRNGIEFSFAGSAVSNLPPGGRVLVVRNLAALNARYGPLPNVAGEYTGSLDNAGERLELLGPLGEPLHDFTFNDRWHPVTDGLGFSLVVVDETAPRAAWASADNWRPSAALHGSPGTADPAPIPPPAVVINEVLVSPPGPDVEFIEIHNPTGAPADLSGWFLSNDSGQPMKYRMPDGTVIPAGGYYTNRSFALPQPVGFTLRDTGGEVYLFSATPAGALTGYRHGFDYEGAEPGVSFGQLRLSTGDLDYPAQTSLTSGATNAGPRVGPVVVNEIMYHPPDVPANGAWWDSQEFEFLELRNLTGAAVPLHDPARPENVWRLRGAVDYEFPPNTNVAANGFVLVVSFNPAADPAALAAFRARYNLAASVPIFGPSRGKLDNSEDDVRLDRPAAPVLPPSPDAGLVPYALVDRVRYGTGSPWPLAADGSGHSLQRVSSAAYGNDPANWIAARPAPAAVTTGGAPPGIVTQPASQTVVAGGAAALSVGAGGGGPLTYQWRFADSVLPGATNATLSLPSFQETQAGVYSVVVMNPAGWILSSNATLTVLLPPRIVAEPQSQTVPLGGVASFAVTATGTPTIRYQWRRNGNDLPGETNAAFTRVNVLSNDVGGYSVLLTNVHGAVTSAVATLAVRLGSDVPLTFIPVGAIWKYHDLGQNLGTAWKETAYNDSAWSNGPAQLGYGDADEARVISYGPDLNNKFPTAYFRRAFVVLDPASVLNLTVRVLRDDGAVLWLNGVEIYRNNMPAGPVLYSSLAPVAISGADETAFYSTNVNPALLVAGTNLLAVEVHQSSGGSSDLSFDAELSGIQTIIPPILTTQPQSQELIAGGVASFSVTTLGSLPLRFQWRFNGVDRPGATSNTLTLLNVQNGSAGSYAVVVTNVHGAVTSAVATLTIHLPPVITQSPVSRLVPAGSNVTFAAAAASTTPLSWQWRFLGTNLPGATNSTLALTAVPTNRAGNYAAVAANVAGSVTSAPARLTVFVTGLTQATLIPAGAVWRYLDTGVDPGTAWRGPAFDDSLWTNGPAQLGYGDSDEARVISFGPDATNKFPAAYFRTRFVVEDAAAFAGLSLRVLRDDGALVYLNGQEVWRDNMPAGIIGHTTYALISTPDETTYFPSSPDTAALVIGTNVLAVEVHQATPGSSDLSFDAELSGVWILPDADADGMPNAWEIIHAFDVNSPADAALDADADGMSNVREFQSGTDPRDASSVLQLVITAQGPALRFTALPHRAYRVVRATNVLAGPWEVWTNLAPAAVSRSIDVPVPGGPPSAFYRVRTP